MCTGVEVCKYLSDTLAHISADSILPDDSIHTIWVYIVRLGDKIHLDGQKFIAVSNLFCVFYFFIAIITHNGQGYYISMHMTSVPLKHYFWKLKSNFIDFYFRKVKIFLNAPPPFLNVKENLSF